MDYQVVDNRQQSRFEIDLGGEKAVAQYTLRDGVIEFTHTEVPLSARGQGIGEHLARGALDHAREENLEVLAFCTFIASFIRNNQEYHDLVKKPG